ncbi:MAG: ribbon-helix-helix domain-containing protein [Kiritimatiellaeota bacterium]|nr:ribbon-helix-helix domain-containing protein [Kiritimatiellota bacterium]
MSTTTVNISFQGRLLSEIDRVAQSESRSRSDLLRESARLYIERKQRWGKLFAYGRKMALRGQLTEQDVTAEVQAHRQAKVARR